MGKEHFYYLLLEHGRKIAFLGGVLTVILVVFIHDKLPGADSSWEIPFTFWMVHMALASLFKGSICLWGYKKDILWVNVLAWGFFVVAFLTSIYLGVVEGSPRLRDLFTPVSIYAGILVVDALLTYPFFKDR